MSIKILYRKKVEYRNFKRVYLVQLRFTQLYIDIDVFQAKRCIQKQMYLRFLSVILAEICSKNSVTSLICVMLQNSCIFDLVAPRSYCLIFWYNIVEFVGCVTVFVNALFIRDRNRWSFFSLLCVLCKHFTKQVHFFLVDSLAFCKIEQRS